MIMLLVILWLAGLATLSYKGKKGGLKISFAVGIAILIALGYGYPTRYWLASLQTGSDSIHSDWKAHNVILVLGAGIEKIPDSQTEIHAFGYGRVVKTAALYQSCKATGNQCSIIVSGGDPVGAGISEAALYGSVLQSIGVAQEDLILETQSRNTWENVKNSAQIITAMRTDEMVLVSSATHLQRSVLYMAHFGLQPDAIVRADYINVVSHSLPQAYNLLVFDLVMHEKVGILRYRLYNAMGWNGDAIENKLKTVY